MLWRAKRSGMRVRWKEQHITGRYGSPNWPRTFCVVNSSTAGPETTETLRQLLAAPAPHEEMSAMQKQRSRGVKRMDERPPVVTSKHVFAAAANLHAAASPGPSGFRNSYSQAAAEHPGGLEVLRQWCNKMANGRMQRSIAQLWAAALVRPFQLIVPGCLW